MRAEWLTPRQAVEFLKQVGFVAMYSRTDVKYISKSVQGKFKVHSNGMVDGVAVARVMTKALEMR